MQKGRIVMLTLTTAQMKRAEELADRQGLSYAQMMENAGAMLFKYLTARYELRERSCAILCGSGNNGGDGLVLARLMLQSGGKRPTVLLCAGEPRTPLAKANYQAFLAAGGQALDAGDIPNSCAALQSSQLIVDAVFGTGFHGELPSPADRIISCANASQATRVAVDIPSGMNADTGETGRVCFAADVTLALAACKGAHRRLPRGQGCGLVEVLDIGIPTEVILSVCSEAAPITKELVQSILPRRRPDSHKGDYGRLLLLCGSRRMCGAAMMAALAALRSGAGLTTLAAPEGVAMRVAPHLMEAMTLPLPEGGDGTLSVRAAAALSPLVRAADACGAGPGLSRGEGVRTAVEALLREAKGTLVLDADALNCLSEEPSLLDLAAKPPILTPHPGEMARLCGMTVPQVTENAASVARLFAKEHRAIVVLKGHRTIVASSEEIYENTTGNSGLAKGGSGDVLTGVISALAAQGLPPRDAALAGVYLHGLAADLLKPEMSEYTMLARDVIGALPAAFLSLER